MTFNSPMPVTVFPFRNQLEGGSPVYLKQQKNDAADAEAICETVHG